MGGRLMMLHAPFGAMAAEGADPACDEAREQVAAIQAVHHRERLHLH